MHPMINNPMFAAMQFQAQPAMTQVPMAQPAQPDQFDAFMNSPYAAMAFQGLSNLAAGMQNRVPQTDPFTAYQAAVATQAQQRIRERMDQRAQAQEMRAQQTHERDMDPFADFDSVISRFGLQGAPMEEQMAAYRQFKLSGTKGVDPGAHAKSMALWQQYNPKRPDETAEQYSERQSQALDTIIRSQLVDYGGGQIAQLGPSGPRLIAGTEGASQRDAEAARLKAYEESLGRTQADRESEATRRVEDLGLTLDVLDSIDKKADGLGEVYGFIRGAVPPLTPAAMDLWSQIDQLQARLTVDERAKLKGQGTITDRESDMLAAAISRLQNRRISESAAREELATIREILKGKIDLTSRYLPRDYDLPDTSGTAGGGEKDDIDI